MWHLAVLEDDAGYAFLLRSSDPFGRVEALNTAASAGSGGCPSFTVERAFLGAGPYEGVLRRCLRDYRDETSRGHAGLTRYICTAQHLVEAALALLPQAMHAEPPGRGLPRRLRDDRSGLLRVRAAALLQQAELLEQRAQALQEGCTGAEAAQRPPPPAPGSPRRGHSNRTPLLELGATAAEEDDQAWMQHLNWSSW